MLQTAEEIIKYIGDAKKQTPIKMYLKGENLPDTDAFHLFGDSHFKIAIGDLDAINAYVEENKDLRIKDIADAVGFKEAYYFSKTFKRETGMWPTEYSARDK